MHRGWSCIQYTYGDGDEGQLGHGDKTNRASLSLVKALEGKNITKVQCGSGCNSNNMALTSSGYVFTWGDTLCSQLGHGNKSKLK